MVKLPPGYVGTVELAFARSAGELVELRADLFEAQAAGVLHDRDHQTLLAERGAHADVDRRRDGDAIFFPPPVDRRRDGHRFRRRFHDVGCVAELHALGRHRRLVCRNRGEIGFEDRRHVRRLADCTDHVLGDGHPHAVVRDVLRGELPRLSGRRLANADDRCIGNGAVDVLAGDAAIAPGPADPRRVDAVLQTGAAHGGREARLDLRRWIAERSRGLRGRRCRSLGSLQEQSLLHR